MSDIESVQAVTTERRSEREKDRKCLGHWLWVRVAAKRSHFSCCCCWMGWSGIIIIITSWRGLTIRNHGLYSVLCTACGLPGLFGAFGQPAKKDTRHADNGESFFSFLVKLTIYPLIGRRRRRCISLFEWLFIGTAGGLQPGSVLCIPKIRREFDSIYRPLSSMKRSSVLYSLYVGKSLQVYCLYRIVRIGE